MHIASVSAGPDNRMMMCFHPERQSASLILSIAPIGVSSMLRIGSPSKAAADAWAISWRDIDTDEISASARCPVTVAYRKNIGNDGCT